MGPWASAKLRVARKLRQLDHPPPASRAPAGPPPPGASPPPRHTSPPPRSPPHPHPTPLRRPVVPARFSALARYNQPLAIEGAEGGAMDEWVFVTVRRQWRISNAPFLKLQSASAWRRNSTDWEPQVDINAGVSMSN